ncbi:MAG: hypothetical protein NKF37_03975, partial [Tropheryma whipplei]|nr:hypothetical protein [Tropheryma whipplei]
FSLTDLRGWSCSGDVDAPRLTRFLPLVLVVAIGVSLAIGLAGCVTGYMRMVPLVLRYQVWLSGGVIRFIRVSRTQVCYPEGPAGDVVSGVDPVCFNPSVLRPQSLILSIYLLTGPVIPVTQPFILVSPS